MAFKKIDPQFANILIMLASWKCQRRSVMLNVAYIRQLNPESHNEKERSAEKHEDTIRVALR